MSRIIGIDLGTTFSEVAVVENRKPRIIPVDGKKLLPSVVGLDVRSGEIIVGWPARNQYILDPENTVKSIKRKMGRREKVRLGERQYLPEEISAFILRKLKAAAESYLGETVSRAVITVPAHFSDAQRQATRDAGEIAGLEVARIINEPTAAALAYGLDRQEDQRVMVYDLGGGTFDVSIVEISQGVVEVLASHGNLYLGGDDFDRLLADYIATEFKQKHGIDLRDSRQSLARLMQASEKAKIELSDKPFAKIAEELIATKDDLPLNLVIEVARHKLEELIEDLVQSTAKSIHEALRAANLRPNEIDKVILVGGSTRIPMVWELIEREMGKPPHAAVDPDMAVALGAAVQAAIIGGVDIDTVLVDVAPYSIGIEVVDFQLGMMVPDVFSPIIKKNTPIPTSKSEVYSTIHDNQEVVEINVYQGESPIASSNSFLGSFKIGGLTKAPAGQVQIVVTLDYDVDGMVHVTAQEKGTTRKKELTVKATRAGMSEQEKKESREHALAAFNPEVATGQEEMQLAWNTIARARDLMDQMQDDEEKKKIYDVILSLEEAVADSEIQRVDSLHRELLEMICRHRSG